MVFFINCAGTLLYVVKPLLARVAFLALLLAVKTSLRGCCYNNKTIAWKNLSQTSSVAFAQGLFRLQSLLWTSIIYMGKATALVIIDNQLHLVEYFFFSRKVFLTLKSRK